MLNQIPMNPMMANIISMGALNTNMIMLRNMNVQNLLQGNYLYDSNIWVTKNGNNGNVNYKRNQNAMKNNEKKFVLDCEF